MSGQFDASESDYREALRINQIVKDYEGIAMVTSNLAQLSLDREDWTGAEVLHVKVFR